MSYLMMRTMLFKDVMALAAATPICSEIVQCLNEKGINAQLLAPTWSGVVARAAIAIKSEDLDAAHERAAKAMSDPRLLKLLKNLSEYIDGTQTHDQLWRVVV
jgi:hypothetical protein